MIRKISDIKNLFYEIFVKLKVCTFIMIRDEESFWAWGKINNFRKMVSSKIVLRKGKTFNPGLWHLSLQTLSLDDFR